MKNIVLNKNLPKQARTVIIGGGVIGSSVAYHLSLNDKWRDTVMLEQGTLTCGTTWHAAGLIGQMRNTSTEVELSKYGSKLYEKLQKEGYSTSWKQCGSLTFSSSKDRLIHLKRNMSRAISFGIEAEIISPEEAKKLWPLVDLKDINGALWLPGDGSAVPTDCTTALAKVARENGVKIFENTRVTGFKTQNKKIVGVKTDSGEIDADVVVLCGGMWTRNLIEHTPLHPCYHMYIVTEEMNVPKDLPIMRDTNGLFYVREWSGGLCVGGFELEAKPCFVNQKPEVLNYHLFEEDWEQFDPIMQNAIKRIPILETTGIRQFVNGPESFTSDNAYILGESPDIKNLYIAAGFNSSGIASAGGAGLALSEWIINDKPCRDLWTVDPRRFAKFQGNNAYLLERVTETLGLHYAIPYPYREMKTARNLRRSPLYHIHKANHAFFGNKFGWERVNCYLPNDNKVDIENWRLPQEMNENVRKSTINTRTNVTIFDQSSFSKMSVVGRDSLKLMQMLACSNCDVEINKLIYTPMLNDNGGYEADVTITRVDENEFMFVSPTANLIRDISRIKRIITEHNLQASIIDQTSAYCCLSLMGPKSRSLLEKVSTANFSNESFPYLTSKYINIGMAEVRADRVTYVGTLGYDIFIPTEMAVYTYELLKEAGKEFSLMNGGYYAIDCMRLEKGYRAWGPELKTTYTPIETGCAFTIDWSKDFIGKPALVKQKERGTNFKIVSFTIDDKGANDLDLLENEPVFRNGIKVGYVTSVKYGHFINKWVGLCIVSCENDSKAKKITNKWIESGKYEVEILQKRYDAEIHLKSPYDPTHSQILCQ